MLKRGVAFAISFLIAIYITATVTGFFQPLRSVIQHAFLPPVEGTDISLRIIRRAWDLLGFHSRSAIQELTNEVDVLRREGDMHRVQLKELAELDAAYAVSPGLEQSAIPARVVTRVLNGFENTILVDHGTKDGIRQGTRVFVTSGYIGYVTSVSSNRAVVQFLASPLHETAGLISELGSPITLEGKGLGIFTARVPRDALVTSGMIVINNASEHLIVGRITAVDDRPNSPFLELLVQSPVNVETIQRVFIERETAVNQ